MEFKLFSVKIHYMDPQLSMLITHGGTSGGAHKREEMVVATSKEDALDRIWNRELEAAEEQNQINLKLYAKQKNGETITNLEQLSVRAPRTPIWRGKWNATEIPLPGYRIVPVEGETAGPG